MPYPKIDRFQFQRDCVEKTTGWVLNIGCHIDPALLKEKFGSRVVNVDRYTEDQISHLKFPVDILFDITKTPWPFADDEFEMVVLGDILEDLHDDGSQVVVLNESRRVGKSLCITTPQDSVERDWHHYTTITEERLRGWLYETKWVTIDFKIIDYLFVPEGYLVYAKKKVTE